MQSFYQLYVKLTEGQTSGKTGLYPLGYGGIGNYPPAYLIPRSADALYYIDADQRLQHVWEKEPFRIDHLKPIPIWTKKQGKKLYIAQTAKLPPGNSVPHKGSKLKGKTIAPKGAKHACCVASPTTLPPTHVGKKAEKFGDPCPHTFKMPD